MLFITPRTAPSGPRVGVTTSLKKSYSEFRFISRGSWFKRKSNETTKDAKGAKRERPAGSPGVSLKPSRISRLSSLKKKKFNHEIRERCEKEMARGLSWRIFKPFACFASFVVQEKKAMKLRKARKARKGNGSRALLTYF